MGRSQPGKLVIDWSDSKLLRTPTVASFGYKQLLPIGSLATGAFATPHNVVPSLSLLHPHFHPQPRPLPPQELVELLKHPFCVGEARRAVLDALEFTYKRPFRDQWEFVEYAQDPKNNVRGADGRPLDLLTPPKRPQQP
jgi:hypothetical protein